MHQLRKKKNNMRKILIILMLNTIFISGCNSIFKRPHDKQVKSSCDVCKEPPFYVNGQRLNERHKR